MQGIIKGICKDRTKTDLLLQVCSISIKEFHALVRVKVILKIKQIFKKNHLSGYAFVNEADEADEVFEIYDTRIRKKRDVFVGSTWKLRRL